MVDEGEYQQTFKEVNHRPCVFGRAMLANCCACQHGQRIHIAEREAMSCLDNQAHSLCETSLNALQKIARFSLKLPDVSGQLPHAQAMRLQCGGLRGIRAVLAKQAQADTSIIANVAALLAQLDTPTNLLAAPLVIQTIVAFKGRKRRRH